MPNVFEFKITGGKELQAALEALPPKLAKKIERGALKDAAEITRSRAAADAPKVTGKLSENFIIRIVRRGMGNALAYRAIIGAQSGVYYNEGELPPAFKKKVSAKYGHNVKQTIVMALSFLEHGTVKERKNPFFTRAWEATKDQVLAKIIQNLKEALGL